MKIPRKNIFKKIADIRRPKILSAQDEIREVPRPEASEKKIEIVGPRGARISPSGFPWKGLIFGITVLAVFGGGFFLFSKYEAKKGMLFDAQQKLNESGFGGGVNLPGSFKIETLGDVTKLWPVIKGSFGAYQGLSDIAGAALALSDDIQKLQLALPQNIYGAKNGATLAALVGIQKDLTRIREASDRLDAQNPEAKNILPITPEEYIGLKYKLRFWEEALGNFASWLSVSDRNVVVFLGNSSELRPTGGFWGSFGEATLRNGDMVSSTVRDISEIDRTLQTKTVPPKPLQLITTNWKTADANWFFNFPDSAAQAKKFLDFSGLYSFSLKKVDLVSVVTPRVISDILSVTGPLSVSSSKIAIDRDNFLPSIQEEVQAGQKARTGQAKNILKDLFPAMLAKVQSLDAAGREKLFNNFINWIAKKDIMLWAEDKNLQSAIEAQGAAGSMFAIPQKFNGDYLAVVAANIGGQKSDYVTKQYVGLEAFLNPDGTVTNHLTVTRRHDGKAGDKWWYTAVNQTYLKIFSSDFGFAPSGSGGSAKTINAPVNYKKEGYATDALVTATEGNASVFKNLSNFTGFRESGKSILTTWVRTPAGKISTISLNYSHHLFLSPADGAVYQFILDKQPGVSGSYDLSFTAPSGFVWAENGSPVYGYKDADIPGRLNINLTLRKSVE
jgi:hypothetical protein